MLAGLSLEDKIDLIGGVSTWFTHAEPKIGLPQMRLSDGPSGLRAGEPATAYPAQIALAATWDPALATSEGEALAHDARARQVDILLAPGVNIARAPMGGRNFEYFGEDPFLASRMAVAYIRGVQSQGVGATVKHFMLNNQEFNRHHASSDADERTMREIYLPAFEAAVKEADVAAVMDSYNLVNGIHSTQNTWMNMTLLKQEWGFRGVVMSDWNSVYDGVAAARGGLDLEMPFAQFMSRETLLPAVRSGALPLSVLDDKVRRILRMELRFGHPSPDAETDSVFSRASAEVALEVALHSAVLLKNEHAALPLHVDKVCTVAVLGPNASPAVMGGGGSAIVDPYRSVSALAGISDYVFAHAQPGSGCVPRVLYDPGLPARYEVFRTTHWQGALRQETFATRDWTGDATREDRLTLNEDRIVTSKTGSLRWTGTYSAGKAGRCFIVVHDGRAADHHSVSVNGTLLAAASEMRLGELTFVPVPQSLRAGESIEVRMDYLPADETVYPGLGVVGEDDLLSSRAQAILKHADAVVVVAGFDKSTEHEGADRTFALPPMQNEMIQQIARRNPNVILALTGGGNVDMRPWIDRVPAVLHLWYPGQEGGTALARILFGEQNPEGRLPVSFETAWEDNPTHDSYYPQSGKESDTPHIRYTEGVFVGYRYYESPSVDRARVRPRFPFGFGLSYTTFKYSALQLSSPTVSRDGRLTVSFRVTNTGSVAGADVAQVYVGETDATLPRPAIELKGFQKVLLQPGQTKTVTLTLDDRAFAFWSPERKQWTVDRGKFVVSVGNSSESLPLRGVVAHD